MHSSHSELARPVVQPDLLYSLFIIKCSRSTLYRSCLLGPVAYDAEDINNTSFGT